MYPFGVRKELKSSATTWSELETTISPKSRVDAIKPGDGVDEWSKEGEINQAPSRFGKLSVRRLSPFILVSSSMVAWSGVEINNELCRGIMKSPSAKALTPGESRWRVGTLE